MDKKGVHIFSIGTAYTSIDKFFSKRERYVLTTRMTADIIELSEVIRMPMTAQEAIRRLKREGWIELRQSGSHKQFIKNGVRITVPDHRGDLKPGLERDIKRNAGW